MEGSVKCFNDLYAGCGMSVRIKEYNEECMNMIRLRNFLRANPVEAKKYFEMKAVFAKEAGYDRKMYKALKSKYVSELIRKAADLS